MRDPPRSAYLAYDANFGVITPSDRLARRRGKPCPHYPAKAVGDPMFDVRRYLERLEQPVPPKPAVLGWSIGAVLAWLKKTIRF